MKQYTIWLILCVSIGILSFTLPPQLMRWTDEQTVDRGHVQKSDEIALVPQASLSLTEKIKLFQRETANTLWISKGKNYDQESIYPIVLGELQNLCELGILEIDVNEVDFYAIEGGFVVDTEDSTQTMNIWTVYGVRKDELYHLMLVLDDETGKIIQLKQYYKAVEYEEKVTKEGSKVLVTEATVSSTGMERVAEAWAEYLGISMEDTYLMLF